MRRKILYCILWSIALFVATFYTIIGQEDSFVFEGRYLLDVAQSHIFPMIMAMALYLMDVMYGVSLKKQNDHKTFLWLLGCLIAFMLTFVSSMMVNCQVMGWSFFLLSWLSLTVLKIVTTDEEVVVPVVITED